MPVPGVGSFLKLTGPNLRDTQEFQSGFCRVQFRNLAEILEVHGILRIMLLIEICQMRKTKRPGAVTESLKRYERILQTEICWKALFYEVRVQSKIE